MRKLLIAAFLLFSLASCSAADQNLQQVTQVASLPVEASPTTTPLPTETSLPPTPTPDYIDTICSPLQDVSLEELSTIITQPFNAPPPGTEDGHTGIDFAFFRFKDYIGIEGLPILAAMEGEVVTILNDRPPYGYTLIVETPLDSIEPNLLSKMQLPQLETNG